MRLIDADALLQRVERWRDMICDTYGKNDEYANCLAEVVMKIEDAPTIDVPERKVGKWVFSPGNAEGICTNCNYKIYGRPYQNTYLIVPYNYCPNCGARMKTADNERDYERAIEQMQHDMLYEKTYNSEDGSMRKENTMIGQCPYDCNNKNEYGYCRSTGCVNPKYQQIVFFTNCNSTLDSPCRLCGNHPMNGGSGICFCTLGNPVRY